MALLFVASRVASGCPDSVVLESGRVSIGSLPTNHLVLADSGVEAIHAMIEIDAKTGVAILVDMADSPRIFLNGRLINVTASLVVGDVVAIGDSVVEVRLAQRGAIDGVGAQALQMRSATAREQLLFASEKHRPTGSTLEVVAFWDRSVLDVRHYGGLQSETERPRPKQVVLGYEHEGHLIGVGPRADTRKLTIASVQGAHTVVSLNQDMQARIRRGHQFEQISGPAEFELSGREMAVIKHGTISYFMTRVALPNPVLQKIAEIDGRPVILSYAAVLYCAMAWLIAFVNAHYPPADVVNDEAWNPVWAVTTPTPSPTAGVIAPVAKPTVVVRTPPPEKRTTPVPRPRRAHEDDPKVDKKVHESGSTQKNVANLSEPIKPDNRTSGERKNTKDNHIGPPKDGKIGNGGGPRGGSSGSFAGQKQGQNQASMPGAENGKMDAMGGLNLDAIGTGLGKNLNDREGAGKIAINVRADSGGVGGGSGAGKRGDMGLGGIGESNSVDLGGPGDTLKGIGGGDFGRGGLGAGGRRSNGGGQKMKVGSLVDVRADGALEGSLSKAEIEAVIRANLAKIKSCYERNLQAKRGLQGRVVASFVIRMDGRVSTVSLPQSDLRDAQTETCIVSEIRRWNFPLPRGGGQVSVTYPFIFTPSS